MPAYTAAVLTVSDSVSQGTRKDLSGPVVAEALARAGFEVMVRDAVPDERERIEATLIGLATQAQLVVTTGGTGIAARDVTPEATRAVCDRLIDGIPERMRSEGFKKTPRAVLSRALCGVRGRTLILNLPGSPSGATESLDAVIDLLSHAIELLAGNTSHSK